MAWPDFALGDLYTAIITKLNSGFTAAGKLFLDQTVGDFANQVRYSSANKRLEYWTGTAWAALDVSASTITNAQSASSATLSGNGAKAWVNFDGRGALGSNMTIRKSYNVDSVLKNNTGVYTLTFKDAMLDANYAVVAMAQEDYMNGFARVSLVSAPSTTSCSVIVLLGSMQGTSDSSRVLVSVFD